MLENAAPSILAPLPQIASPRTNPSRIAIKANRKIVFIDPAEVLTAEAHGNYVLFQCLSGPAFLLRQSISAVAEKLLPDGFVRIHRSTLVNSAFVEEILPLTTGESLLRIKGGKEFHVSRTFRKIPLHHPALARQFRFRRTAQTIQNHQVPSKELRK